MVKVTDIPRIATGVPNLERIFNGGLPKGSVTVVSGPPGSGKTILTQQIYYYPWTPYPETATGKVWPDIGQIVAQG